MLTNKVACGDGEHAAVQEHHDSSPRRWYRAQRRATSMYVCMYVCMYVYGEMLIPRTCFSIGVTTHLDVAGTTPAEIVCMYVRLNTRKGNVP